jgi:hypothetical protein
MPDARAPRIRETAYSGCSTPHPTVHHAVGTIQRRNPHPSFTHHAPSIASWLAAITAQPGADRKTPSQRPCRISISNLQPEFQNGAGLRPGPSSPHQQSPWRRRRETMRPMAQPRTRRDEGREIAPSFQKATRPPVEMRCDGRCGDPGPATGEAGWCHVTGLACYPAFGQHAMERCDDGTRAGASRDDMPSSAAPVTAAHVTGPTPRRGRHRASASEASSCPRTQERGAAGSAPAARRRRRPPGRARG